MSTLDIPPSTSTVRIRAIDCRSDQVVDASAFIDPVLPGQATLNLPTMAFLVDHPAKRKRVLFDCGGRRDHQMYALGVRQKMDEILIGMKTERDIDEILLEAGITLETVDSMIWSHWHFDHHGAPEKFPPSVEIVVGPRFKELFMPGFPVRPDAILADAYFEGREVREVSFDTSLVVGGFPAVDYFGDGSFYLLDSPGHAVGHMCALARTTPTTFVFLGGDICHSPGVYRPNTAYHVPAHCACSHIEVPDAPLFHLSSTANTVSLDVKAGQESIAKMLQFEASADVLVCIAHDLALVKMLPLLNDDPSRDINDWQVQGYKDKARWFWLSELPLSDGSPGPATLPFVDGKYWRGIKINSWAEPVPESKL
ncbi:hypothetical protein SEUCBS139899_005932 [Sporothrix eucalyptigena]